MSTVQQHSYIRKVSEDAKLRPFLSSHFDVEAYLRSVVEKNKSEECFKDITVCIGNFHFVIFVSFIFLFRWINDK